MATRDETAEPARRMALATFAVRVAAAALAYGLQVALARTLGGHAYGIYVVVWTAVTLAGSVAGLGFETLVVRSTPKYLAARAFGLLRGLITSARLIAFTVACALALVAVALIQVFSGTVEDDWRVPVMLAAACLPLFAVTEVQDGTARAQGWTGLALGPTYLLRPTLILAGVAALVGFGAVATTDRALIVTIAATVATALVQMLILERRLHRVAPAPERELRMAAWTREALPIFGVDLAFVLVTGADVLMVGALAAPADVAVYYAAAKSLALVQFVHFAVRTAASRDFALRVHAGDRAALRAAARRAGLWTFWPSAAFAVVTVVAGPWLLGLFGGNFRAGLPVMIVLAVGLLARASVGPAETLLTMSGRQGVAALVYAGSLAVTLSLGVMLTPIFGIVGAAAAAAVGMAAEAFLFAETVRRLLGIEIFVFAGGAPAEPLAGKAAPWAG